MPPAPRGVTEELWSELTTELARVVSSRGASAVKPLADSQFAVDDYRITGIDGQTATIAWTYRNPGDYDQNGEVNASDLVPLARHYGKTTADADWGEARLADGNGNGEVEFGDVTPLGQNYRNTVSGYSFLAEWHDANADEEVNIADLPSYIRLGATFPVPGYGNTWPDNREVKAPYYEFYTDPSFTPPLFFPLEPNPPGPFLLQRYFPLSQGTAPAGGGPLAFEANIPVIYKNPSLGPFGHFDTLEATWSGVAAHCDHGGMDEFGPPSNLAPLPRIPRLARVRSFMYQLQGLEEPGAVEALAAADYDLLVVEPTGTVAGSEDFDMGAMVDTLRADPQTGLPDKLVLAYLNAGQGEDYRSYWVDGGWQPPSAGGPGTPDFIITNDPGGWPGNYPVAFWDERWQDVLVGSELVQLVNAGFDGVYLDWVEGYQETSVAAAAQAAGKDPAREMVALLQLIRDTARAIDPDFIVIQQGAPYLNVDGGDTGAGYARVFDAVDGIGLEDVWFGGESSAAWGDPNGGDIPNTYTGDSSTQALLSALHVYQHGPERFESDDNKLVLTIDYCLNPANAAHVYSESRAEGFIALVTQVSLSRITETPPPAF